MSLHPLYEADGMKLILSALFIVTMTSCVTGLGEGSSSPINHREEIEMKKAQIRCNKIGGSRIVKILDNPSVTRACRHSKQIRYRRRERPCCRICSHDDSPSTNQNPPLSPYPHPNPHNLNDAPRMDATHVAVIRVMPSHSACLVVATNSLGVNGLVGSLAGRRPSAAGSKYFSAGTVRERRR